MLLDYQNKLWKRQTPALSEKLGQVGLGQIEVAKLLQSIPFLLTCIVEEVFGNRITVFREEWGVAESCRVLGVATAAPLTAKTTNSASLFDKTEGARAASLRIKIFAPGCSF